MRSKSKLSALFELGEVKHGGKWMDYLQFGFNDQDVFSLLLLVGNESLHDADVESDEVWVPLHAWRTLAQLGSASSIEPLLALFDLLVEDDWAIQDLPVVVGMLGAPAVEPLTIYMNEIRHKEFARVIAADGLKEIAERHPECREAVIEALTAYLRAKDKSLTTMNGLIVCCLIDLQASESIEVIRDIYSGGMVDISCAGDLEEVEISLGLRDQRSTPKPDYATSHQAKEKAPLISPDPESVTLFEELDEYLLQYGCDESILNISELDGFFAAILAAPEMIMPSEWMAAIWGGKEHTPEWPDVDHANKFISAVMVFYNQVAQALDDDSFQALFFEKEVEGKTYDIVDEWCEGFLRGMAMWPSLSAANALVVERALEVIRLFATEQGMEQIEAMDIDEVESMQYEVERSALELYHHFRRQMGDAAVQVLTEPKVGRNDPCPCGSGKKFKKCCLH
ncbi:MAG: UPF0149 family protein [Candidatus Polarisedimenticolaceae bacterium]|nr:UPF0149 family protein [Candidatus Polarisedimenticolaceae bacterium]